MSGCRRGRDISGTGSRANEKRRAGGENTPGKRETQGRRSMGFIHKRLCLRKKRAGRRISAVSIRSGPRVASPARWVYKKNRRKKQSKDSRREGLPGNCFSMKDIKCAVGIGDVLEGKELERRGLALSNRTMADYRELVLAKKRKILTRNEKSEGKPRKLATSPYRPRAKGAFRRTMRSKLEEIDYKVGGRTFSVAGEGRILRRLLTGWGRFFGWDSITERDNLDLKAQFFRTLPGGSIRHRLTKPN